MSIQRFITQQYDLSGFVMANSGVCLSQLEEYVWVDGGDDLITSS